MELLDNALVEFASEHCRLRTDRYEMEHGAAVSLACLHAMRAAGATRVVVYPRGDSGYPVPKKLYFGLGFLPVARTLTYTR